MEKREAEVLIVPGERSSRHKEAVIRAACNTVHDTAQLLSAAPSASFRQAKLSFTGTEAQKWDEYFVLFLPTQEKLLLAVNIKSETNCLLLTSEAPSFRLPPGCLL